jgi:hypothetical protein
LSKIPKTAVQPFIASYKATPIVWNIFET